MAHPRLVRWLIIGVVLIGVAGAALVVAVMAFVFSIGTATVRLDVRTRVIDRATRQPVARCVLAFERDQRKGYGQTDTATDAMGMARHEVSYGYTGSPLMYWDRDRHPKLTFYLGAAPRYDTRDEVETWLLELSFDEPSRGGRLSPDVRVERVLSFEDTQIDGKFRQAGSRPLAAPEAGALGPIEMTFSRDADGYPRWEIPLDITLDAAQIARCRGGIGD